MTQQSGSRKLEEALRELMLFTLAQARKLGASHPGEGKRWHQLEKRVSKSWVRVRELQRKQRRKGESPYDKQG